MEQVRKSISLNFTESKLYNLEKKGILFLPGEIDQPTSLSFMLDMFTIQSERTNKNLPIWIIIDSVGGSPFSGFTIYDTIRGLVESGVPVHTLGIGLIASMATVILQAGLKRYALPNTQFLVHQARISTEEGEQTDVEELEERSAELRRVNDRTIKVLADRSGMDLKKIKAMAKKKDCWIDVHRAKEFGPNGLIDEVVTAFPFEI
jgi:ATP-dependent Clp endopeptidase proteolytic subunit ClpP